MIKVSPHFSRIEFACKCGCMFEAVDVELIHVLEGLRTHFAVPLIVNSGNRCIGYNQGVGGSINSKHTKGIAADIRMIGVSSQEIYDYLVEQYPDKYGIGLYSKWVHIDVRPIKARWSK